MVRYLYTDTHAPYGRINNLHFADNLKARFTQLKQITTDGILEPLVFDDRPYLHWCNTIRENIFRFLIVAFISNLALVFLFKRSHRELKLLLSIYLLYIIMFFTSCFWPVIKEYHLALLYPFPQLTIAIFISYLSLVISRICLNSPLLKKLTIGLVSLAILLPLVLFDVRAIISYHSILRKTGGRGVNASCSPVLYDFVTYVKENKLNQYPIICSGGLSAIIAFITKGELVCDYEFYNNPENRQISFEKLESILSKANRIYSISDAHDDAYESAFKQNIISLNKKITLEKTFYNKVKEPQYYLYKVE